jgi:glucose-1-phosphate adenylyltransferase
MVKTGMRVFAFPFGGYWVDVGTIDSYWRAHMDLLKHPPELDLNDRSWIIHTRSEERPPALIQSGATVRDCLISDGVTIAPGAVVERCVLSPGVYVGPQAVVRESIILTDASCGVLVGPRVLSPAKKHKEGGQPGLVRHDPDVPCL